MSEKQYIVREPRASSEAVWYREEDFRPAIQGVGDVKYSEPVLMLADYSSPPFVGRLRRIPVSLAPVYQDDWINTQGVVVHPVLWTWIPWAPVKKQDYTVKATLTSHIQLTVTADSQQQAMDKAHDYLQRLHDPFADKQKDKDILKVWEESPALVSIQQCSKKSEEKGTSS